MRASTSPRSPAGRPRRATATAAFGSSRREAHDASAFYDRFVVPEISGDDTVMPAGQLDVIHLGDARDMAPVAANSVALVVTSPPYFAGKEYEQALGENGVPATYFEYLALLRAVFAECKRVLEPGGRLAINVANLGRRPYRSLASDVTGILQDLGLLLRGEVVWCKGRAAGGSCAWGTFQHPANPVLRDVTERIVIASKGRFDRALPPAQRRAAGYPSAATISRDEFLEATTDLWEIPPESATRVGHPAPFPVELPRRLIELYTYEGDVVLDPFMGSGTTAVAARRAGRHFIGFDTDPAYVARAEARLAAEPSRNGAGAGPATGPGPVRANGTVERTAHEPTASTAGAPAGASPGEPPGEPPGGQRAAIAQGRRAGELAAIILAECGFEDIRADVKLARLGVELSFLARDRTGGEWGFDLSGAFTATRAGLRRTDALWKAFGKAAVIHHSGRDLAMVLLTTDAPAPRSAGDAAMAVMRGPDRPVLDVIELLDADAQQRLRDYALRGRPDR